MESSSASQSNEEPFWTPVHTPEPVEDNRTLPFHSSSGPLTESAVVLVVDGTRFAIEQSNLMKYPNTMLGRMFTTGIELAQQNHNGEYEISQDISREVFAVCLDYYKMGKIQIPSTVSVADVREACKYLMVPFDPKEVGSEDLCGVLREVSNDGARKQFEHYLKDILYPALIAVAERGDREVHIVILTNNDVIMWNQDYPPRTGEEYFQVIYNTALQRFLKYTENREVAKQVLMDRGLKKIRCGIEGYPTTMEKTRRRRSGRIDGVYNYVQRPYFEISWQRENHNYVDFQCIKTRSVSSLSEANADPNLSTSLPVNQMLALEAERDAILEAAVEAAMDFDNLVVEVQVEDIPNVESNSSA